MSIESRPPDPVAASTNMLYKRMKTWFFTICIAIAGGSILYAGIAVASIPLEIAGTLLLILAAYNCVEETIGYINRYRQRKQGGNDELVRFRRERPDMHLELVQMRVPAQDATIVISHPRPAVVHGGNGSVEKGNGQT